MQQDIIASRGASRAWPSATTSVWAIHSSSHRHLCFSAHGLGMRGQQDGKSLAAALFGCKHQRPKQ
jgi:hypothetical protein